MEKTAGDQYSSPDAVLELLSLLNLYTQLLERQIEGVRTDMAATVASLMQQVSMISAARGTQAKMADSILIKGSAEPSPASDPVAADQFVAVSAKAIEQGEQARLVAELELRKGVPSPNVTEVGTRLRACMGSLDQLDSRLEAILFTIVGALSAEDIVGQRIAHISEAVAHLKDGISEVVSWPEAEYCVPSIEAVIERIKVRAYQAYTMEAEKNTFVEVFAENPKKQQV